MVVFVEFISVVLRRQVGFAETDRCSAAESCSPSPTSRIDKSKTVFTRERNDGYSGSYEAVPPEDASDL
jgi:hypothetical protein